MPIINNVNNGYNNNNRKLSSKLTFEVGEKFTGKIVEKGEGKDITIRTADGWQFIAETDNNVNAELLHLSKFQVEGYENGKLKLKVLHENGQNSEEEDENFQDIIKKEGLSKEDINILKNMVKHSIPLTKENINQMKGLIIFNENLNSDPEEMDNFIKSYLESIEVDLESSQGQSIKNLLTEFLNKFKDMSAEEILTFIENKLELSSENIDAFNNVFKSDFSIEKLILKINGVLEENLNGQSQLIKENEDYSIYEQLNENIKNDVNENSTSAAAKIYAEKDYSNLDVLDILKTLAGKESKKEEGIEVKEIEIKEQSLEKLNLPKEIADKVQDEKVGKIIRNILEEEELMRQLSGNSKSSSDESSKIRIEKFLSNQMDKDINLTEAEFKEIKDFINKKISEDKITEGSTTKAVDSQIHEEEIKQAKKSTLEAVDRKIQELQDLENKSSVKTQMKDRIRDVSNAVKNILSNLNPDSEVYSKITTMIKQNINEIKVFNTMNNEYYYLNMPIQNNSQEYPCKLIIKDNRKDGKKIDSTNAKMVVNIKTINLGNVDGFITMTPKKITIQLQCEDKYCDLLNKYKNNLLEGLNSINQINTKYIAVTVKNRKNENNIINTREFFNDYSISNIDILV